MSEPFKLLISGSGISGPVLAYWLARASTASKPIQITVIERASSLLKSGQGIDIEGPAREIVSRMGIFDEIKARTTGERGFCCIDDNNRTYAHFEGGGLTNEFEIMRGDLCDILTSVAKEMPSIEFQYGRHVTDIIQTNDQVHVTITKDDGHSYEGDFNAVVASDGIRSTTRNLMLDAADTEACIKPVDMFVAYFSVPTQPQDKSYSRFQHALGGRSVIIRPVTDKFSSVYLMAVGKHPALSQSLGQRSQKTRRQAWAETMTDVNYGEFPRVISEMQNTDNFYSDQVAQVKLPRWYNGRCALVGDAAYCPALLTGQGTELAMLGSYVLAGELAKNLNDPVRGFEAYDRKLRAYVEKNQTIHLWGWAPAIFNPQTAWGIWLLQLAFWVVANTLVGRLIPDLGESHYKLPEYNFG